MNKIIAELDQSYEQFAAYTGKLFGAENLRVDSKVVDLGAEITTITHEASKTRVALWSAGKGVILQEGLPFLRKPSKNKPKQRKAVSTESKSTKDRTPRTESKSAKAAAIYAEAVKAGASRKEILERFVSELQMSKAGASTYYQNIKKASA